MRVGRGWCSGVLEVAAKHSQASTNVPDALTNFLSIRAFEIGSGSVLPPITGQVLRKAFGQKRKEYFLSGRLEKKDVRAKLIGSGGLGGSRYGFQVFAGIGEQGQNRARDHADLYAR